MTWLVAIPITAMVFAAANVVWATRQAFVMAREGEPDWLSKPMFLWTVIAATLATLFLTAAMPGWPRLKTSIWCLGLLLTAAHVPSVIFAQRFGTSRRRPPPFDDVANSP